MGHQRLEEANDMAAKGGKNAIARMEARIRELEAELGAAQSRTSETYKAYQKCERRLKELQFQQDEEKKNQDRMSDLATKLKKQKRLQLLIWPSTEKLSKNWRRLRNDPTLLRINSLPIVNPEPVLCFKKPME